MRDLRVNQTRLWNSLMEMAQVGRLPGGGCCRLALDRLDGAGRDLFVGWCREAGCSVEWDQVGNIFARREGKRADAPAVATGSHLDTQPHGGKFDGVYGVLAGLEVIRTLNDHGVETEAPVEVIVWTNEEASRFHPPLTGSSAFIGQLSPAFVHEIETVDGTKVKADLAKIGYLGKQVPGSRLLDSFIEVHIEQGPILEREGKTIGVVTQVQGMRFLTVRVQGEDGHAGTMPMQNRRDALVGTAKMLVFLSDLALSLDEQIRITVGSLNVLPGSLSTIPGEVRFTIDLRHPDADVLASTYRRIEEGLANIAEAHGLSNSVQTEMERSPVDFHPSIIELVENSANALQISSRRISSGAGHDAMNLAQRVPTGMIFIPCEDGVSHNERENAMPEHLAAGANVLLRSMMARSNFAVDLPA